VAVFTSNLTGTFLLQANESFWAELLAHIDFSVCHCNPGGRVGYWKSCQLPTCSTNSPNFKEAKASQFFFKLPTIFLQPEADQFTLWRTMSFL
jgi:hypothetical protein